MKSSEIRNNLKPTLKLIRETGEPIDIDLDGKVVARLTLEPPSSGTPPMRIRTAEAVKKWSELLNYAFIMGARFYFRVRFNEDDEATTVFLLRPDASRNHFDSAWKEHKAQVQTSKVTPEMVLESIDELRETLTEDVKVALESMQEFTQKSVQQINEKIGIAFAGLNRPYGDLQATPESGLVSLYSAKHLDSYEAD
jgi:hypothetical protein